MGSSGFKSAVRIGNSTSGTSQQLEVILDSVAREKGVLARYENVFRYRSGLLHAVSVQDRIPVLDSHSRWYPRFPLYQRQPWILLSRC